MTSPARWKWLSREIERLDPETRYDDIIRLVAEHTLNRTIVDLTLLVTTGQTAIAPAAATALHGTGKLLHRGDQRLRDGSNHLVTWFTHGASSPETHASIDRLNRLHLGLARRWPGAFGDNDDYVYTLCAVGDFLPRMRETLDLPPQSPTLDVAWHHFLRDLAGQFVGEHGPVTGFPDDLAGVRAFAAAYEARDWAPTEAGHLLYTGMVDLYAERGFPPPMRWFGRAQALLLTPPRVRELHRTGEPPPAQTAAVRALMRRVLLAQDHWWPDRRRRFTEVQAARAARAAARARRSAARAPGRARSR